MTVIAAIGSIGSRDILMQAYGEVHHLDKIPQRGHRRVQQPAVR
jgi:hypothetical protein